MVEAMASPPTALRYLSSPAGGLHFLSLLASLCLHQRLSDQQALTSTTSHKWH